MRSRRAHSTALALALISVAAPALAGEAISLGDPQGLRGRIEPARLAVTFVQGDVRQVATNGLGGLGRVRPRSVVVSAPVALEDRTCPVHE